MKLGIDFGKTIACRREDGVVRQFNGAFHTIRLFIQEKIPVYIISKVDQRQKEEVLEFLHATDFYWSTGFQKEKLYFCEQRAEKAEIAKVLGITHHIDDRPEVMAHMTPDIRKYLFNPVPEDLVKFFNQIRNTMVVKNWDEIQTEIFNEYFKQYRPLLNS